MKLEVNSNGVFLDGVAVQHCTAVDIKNISPGDTMEAVLHVDVDEADISYRGTKE